MRPDDIASIERATLAAVPPERLEEFEGWLLPFDSGTVGRAKSAVPLSHQEVDVSLLDALEQRYRDQNLPAIFRIAGQPCFDDLRRELTRRGYRATRPTQVMLGSARAMGALAMQGMADIADAPDAAWTALFLGEGFDPVDGACRVRLMARAKGSVYASVREEGRTLAAGAGAFSHGWASVHGMRTDPGWRGRGLAGRVLAAIAAVALQQGHERVFLQVQTDNTAALSLYRRAGFTTGWTYDYWGRAG